jgi:hypothetical protein
MCFVYWKLRWLTLWYLHSFNTRMLSLALTFSDAGLPTTGVEGLCSAGREEDPVTRDIISKPDPNIRNFLLHAWKPSETRVALEYCWAITLTTIDQVLCVFWSLHFSGLHCIIYIYSWPSVYSVPTCTGPFFVPWRHSHHWAQVFSSSRIHDHTQTHYTR